MRVPEAVPRNVRQSERFASGPEFTSQQVLGIEWRLVCRERPRCASNASRREFSWVTLVTKYAALELLVKRDNNKKFVVLRLGVTELSALLFFSLATSFEKSVWSIQPFIPDERGPIQTQERHSRGMSRLPSRMLGALCFIFRCTFCNRRQFRLGDGEAREAATQTYLYLEEHKDAGLVQMLEPTEMNHHLSRQFGLFG